MADRYNNAYETAPKADPIGDGNKAKGSPRSAFNKSKTKWMNGIFGALMPFDVLRTYPGSDHELDYDVIASTRYPMLRKLKNNVRIYIHSYYVPCRDCWEGWDNYMSKGRSGTIAKSVPKYLYMTKNGLTASTFPRNYSEWVNSNKPQVSGLSPLSPLSYMQGICSGWYEPTNKPNGPGAMKNQFTDIVRDDGLSGFHKVFEEYGESEDPKDELKLKINALPLVAYIKIVRDYYMNANLLYNNKNWYPDNDDEFILPYENPKAEFGSNGNYTEIDGWDNTENYVNALSKKHALVFYGTSEEANDNDEFVQKGIYVPYSNSTRKPLLNKMHFRQFRGDYFTSGSPFQDLIRGNAPILSTNMINSNINFEDVFTNIGTIGSGAEALGYINGKITPVNYDSSIPPKPIHLSETLYNNMLNAWNKAKIATDAMLVVKMNDLRKLQALTIFAERNARVNQPDIYNGVIKAQFGYYPDAENRTPVYIGGTYMDVNFSEVEQTSETRTNKGEIIGNPLGTVASRGKLATNGYIGKFHAKDHGYIISIMSILPEVIYMDGLDRELNITEQEDEYFPILEGLAPQATLKKELKINGTNNNDIFNYVDRYSYAKSRRSEVVGWNKLYEWDKAQFMTRKIQDNPTFNNAFVTCSWDNVDMGDAWFSATEPPFDITVNCNVKAVLPMSFYAEPSDLGY